MSDTTPDELYRLAVAAKDATAAYHAADDAAGIMRNHDPRVHEVAVKMGNAYGAFRNAATPAAIIALYNARRPAPPAPPQVEAAIDDLDIMVVGQDWEETLAALRLAITAARDQAVREAEARNVQMRRFADQIDAAMWCNEWFDQVCAAIGPRPDAEVYHEGPARTVYIGAVLQAATFIVRDQMNFSLAFRVPIAAAIRGGA